MAAVGSETRLSQVTPLPSPLCAYVEFLVCFESFRNVGLHGQGLYFVKANLYPSEPPEIFGVPLAHFHTDHQLLAKNGITILNRIKEAHVNDDFSFSTRSFLVRFQQEEVPLCDAVTFTLKLPYDPLKGNRGLPVVILEFDLYHVKASVLAANKKWLAENKETQVPKRVSRVRLKIRNPLKPLSQSYPVLFEERYFCRLDVSVYSCVMHISETRNYVSADPPNLSQLSWLSTQYFFGSKVFDTGDNSPSTRLAMISHATRIYQTCYELLVGSHKKLLESMETLLAVFTPKEKEMIAEAASSSGLKTLHLNSEIIDPGDTGWHQAMFTIMSNLYDIGSEISTSWVKFLSAMTVNMGDLAPNKKRGERKILRRWMESVFYESYTPPASDPVFGHAAIVAERRKSEYYSTLKPLAIEDEIFEFNPDECPIIFECSRPSFKPPRARDSEPPIVIGRNRVGLSPPNPFQEKPGPHLWVLVHGLKGSAFDLRLYKHHISSVNEDTEFLAISSIEENTLDDIKEMGRKVASEIINYMRVQTMEYSKISFIGHSLGGLIIRAALADPELEIIHKKLYTFITLATPHLGGLYYAGSLVPSAMWFWEKWTAALCLKQLRLIDASTPEQCYLYKLAANSKYLSNFKNVLLIGSEQDYYVPFHSTRLDLPQELDIASSSSSSSASSFSSPSSTSLPPAASTVSGSTSSPALTPITLSSSPLGLPPYSSSSSSALHTHSSPSLSSRPASSSSSSLLPSSIGKLGVVYHTMRDSLLFNLANVNLIRFDVHFGPSAINLSKFDTLTGRGAHIAVLDDEFFVRMFTLIYQQYFI